MTQTSKKSSSRKPAAKKSSSKKTASKKTTVQTDRGSRRMTDDQSKQQVDGVEEEAATPMPTPDEIEKQEHEARVAHNARTGGGEVHEGELQAQRDEHNARTSGFKY